MDILRTPDARFENLPDYPFAPNYTTVPCGEPCGDPRGDGGELRIHYVDEGTSDDVVLCMHGEPSWSYLYRHMIPKFVAAGLRAVAPDLVGFGRSDKPGARTDYTYQSHVDWMTAWLEANDLTHVTLIGQDWGGLIGLRLAAENPDRFDRIVVANTGMPTGEGTPSEAFMAWRKFSQDMPEMLIGELLKQAWRSAGRGRCGLRRALPRRKLQGRRTTVSAAGADLRRRPGGGCQPARLDGARVLAEAAADGVQRWRRGHRRG